MNQATDLINFLSLKCIINESKKKHLLTYFSNTLNILFVSLRNENIKPLNYIMKKNGFFVIENVKNEKIMMHSIYIFCRKMYLIKGLIIHLL